VKLLNPSSLLGLIIVLLAGCVGINPGTQLNASGTQPNAPAATGNLSPRNAEFVYVANLGSASNPGGSISGFAVNQQTGALAPVSGSPFPAGDAPGGITSDPSGQHVFVIEKKFSLSGDICSQAKGILLSENIESHSGRLRLADKVTLGGSCPQSLVVDPEGKTLYVSEETSNTAGMLDGGEIQAFAIQRNGTLKEISGSPFPVAGGAGALAIHPAGKLLYVVTGMDGQGIVVFARDPGTGRLDSAQAVAARSEAHLAIMPSGKLMIAENASIIDQVTVFNIDPASGALAAQPPMAAWLPRAVAVDPLGEFVALAVASPDNVGLPGEIRMFRIDDSTGTMTQVPGTPVAAGNGPFDVKFDPQGTLVYSVATNDNSIAGFMLDRSSGALTAVSGSPFKAGDNPMELTIARPK
jgi:6-phosphogluconolactonase